MKLNGWERIWLVLAVALGVIAVGIGVLHHEESSLPEDAAVYLEAARGDSRKVWLVDDPRPFTLPRNFPDDELGNFIVNLPSQTYEAAQTAADLEFQEIALFHADRARLSNETARENNRKLYIILGTSWLLIVVMTYISGWLIGWIQRGFRAN